MKKTRANILKVAKEYGFSEDAFVKMIKRRKINGAFKVEFWDKYMVAITGHVSCVVCNGPQKRVWPSYSYLKLTNYCECIENRGHSVRFTCMANILPDEEERIKWILKS